MIGDSSYVLLDAGDATGDNGTLVGEARGVI